MSDLNKMVKDMQNTSSEGLAGFYSKGEGYHLIPIGHCEKCGSVTVLDDTSIDFQVENATEGQVRNFMINSKVKVLSDKPPYLGHCESLGMAVCEACDE